jgi:hypothetical protein
MAGWRCPHCGSPQAETSRCWVCHRSTTSCASCRHFCKSIAGRLGYCAQDKNRTPIDGTEQRACWERASAEELEATNPLPARSRPQANPSGAGLWDAIIAGENAPDRAAPSIGMWTESDSARDPEADRRQHGGSIRSQPWGPVPGHRDESGWRRGLKAATRRP